MSVGIRSAVFFCTFTSDLIFSNICHISDDEWSTKSLQLLCYSDEMMMMTNKKLCVRIPTSMSHKLNGCLSARQGDEFKLRDTESVCELVAEIFFPV